MKSLEHYQVNQLDSNVSNSIFYITINEAVNEKHEDELNSNDQDCFENLYDDEEKLISNSSSLKRRNSSKKTRISRKKNKFNKIINFFRN